MNWRIALPRWGVVLALLAIGAAAGYLVASDHQTAGATIHYPPKLKTRWVPLSRACPPAKGGLAQHLVGSEGGWLDCSAACGIQDLCYQDYKHPDMLGVEVYSKPKPCAVTFFDQGGDVVGVAVLPKNRILWRTETNDPNSYAYWDGRVGAEWHCAGSAYVKGQNR